MTQTFPSSPHEMSRWWSNATHRTKSVCSVAQSSSHVRGSACGSGVSSSAAGAGAATGGACVGLESSGASSHARIVLSMLPVTSRVPLSCKSVMPRSWPRSVPHSEPSDRRQTFKVPSAAELTRKSRGSVVVLVALPDTTAGTASPVFSSAASGVVEGGGAGGGSADGLQSPTATPVIHLPCPLNTCRHSPSFPLSPASRRLHTRSV